MSGKVANLQKVISGGIEAVMRDNNISQREFAKLCDIPQSRLSLILSGKAKMRVDDLERLSRGSRIHPGALCGGLDPQIF